MADRSRASGRPTLDDVAAVAGVSRMVASRALNGSDNVSPSASRKVKAAISMLGYVPHQGARSLATNKTGAIAFLAPMVSERFFRDPNVATIVSGLKQELTASGHQLVTLIVEDAEDGERVGQFLRAGHVDGAVILSPELAKPLVRDLQQNGLPLAGNGVVEGADAMDSIIFDNRQAARTVAQHLFKGGANQLAVIAGSAERDDTQQVLAGIRDVYGTLDERLVKYTDHSFEAGQAAAHALIEASTSIDGLFVAADTMASAAVPILQAAGRSVPDDIRVTGWDNSLPANFVNPRLTTLEVPFRTIGQSLGRMLIEQLAGVSGGRIETIKPHLIVRESA